MSSPSSPVFRVMSLPVGKLEFVHLDAFGYPCSPSYSSELE